MDKKAYGFQHIFSAWHWKADTHMMFKNIRLYKNEQSELAGLKKIIAYKSLIGILREN